MSVARDNVVDVVDAPVRLAPGVDLLGEYMDSGFSRPQYLLRRPDGLVVVVSKVLYLVAAALRHHDRLGTVARVVGEQLGRPISAADVDHLISTELRPAGVLAAYGDRLVVVPRTSPPRGLSLRVGAVPWRLQRALTSVFGPLFHLPVAANAVAVIVVTDVWLATQAARLRDAWVHVASSLPLVLAVAGLMIASLAFHELGRASACRFGGGRPGSMGIGVNIVWPAVHVDVSDAYRLGWRGRLRTHLGGVYTDLVFALGVAAGYALTGSETLLAALILPQVHALWQLLPVARLDGYYLLSDVVGVPNLFAYLPAATATLLPLSRAAHRRASHTLDALTQPARTALRTWVALTAGVLALELAVAAYLAPRTLVQLWRSTRRAGDRLVAAAGDAQWATAANLTLQVALVALLTLGGAVLIGRAGRPAGRRILTAARPATRTQRRMLLPPRAAFPVLLLGTALLAAAAGFVASRLTPSDPPASVSIASATTTTPPTHDPVPSPRPPTGATAGMVQAAAGPSEGGAHGPAAPPPETTSASPFETTPASPPDATPAPPAMGWIVRPGDDLWSIAQLVQSQVNGREPTEEETRSYWTQLLEANPTSPQLLHAGQALVLPTPRSPQPGQPAGGSQPPDGARAGAAGNTLGATWTVQPGEDLWTIAEHVETQVIGRTPSEQETAGYWTTLVAANRDILADVDNPDLLYKGQVVTVPPLGPAEPAAPGAASGPGGS